MKILSKTFTFSPQETKTNHVFSFYVDDAAPCLKVHVVYSPKWVTDRARLRELTWAGAQKFDLLPKDTAWTSARDLPEESIFPVCNMITFSLDHNGEFVGYAHRHPEDQTVLLTPASATPGFLPVENIRGDWRMTVSVCSVDTPQCTVQIDIETCDETPAVCREEVAPAPAPRSGSAWLPCELHTHTCHSDGSFTAERLLETAKEQGLRYIATTDHNTISAQREMTPAMQERWVRVAMGIEWTTFFGHVLVIGADRFVDWRSAEIDTLEPRLDEVRAAGGIAGIAHPYSPGEPFCCGCHWDFKIKDWSHFAFVELWSESEPQFAVHNQMAYRFWMERLKAGQRLTGISARDWHGDESNDIPYAVTYLYLDESLDATEAVKAALLNGRAYMTMGPTIAVCLESPTGRFTIGDTAPAGEYQLKLLLSAAERQHIWKKFQIEPQETVVLDADGETLARYAFQGYRAEMGGSLSCKAGLVRMEARGTMGGRACTLLITNPIYVQ